MRPNWSIYLLNSFLVDFAVFSIYILSRTLLQLSIFFRKKAYSYSKMKICSNRHNQKKKSWKGCVYHFDYWVMKKKRVTVPVPFVHVPLATCIAANRKRNFRHTNIIIITQLNEMSWKRIFHSRTSERNNTGSTCFW